MGAKTQPRPRRRAGKAAAKEQPATPIRRFLAATDVRHIVIEILIVATGVFIALVVDELRRTVERRSLVTQTRAELRAEALLNRSRMARKLYLLRSAARTLEAQPYRAAELVEARRNDVSRPLDAAWAIANQTEALRFLGPEERRRITESYTAERVYIELTTDEMDAWTQLARTAGADASIEEARERDRAIRIWKAYAGRVALATCLAAVRIEAQLDHKISNTVGAHICPTYRLDGNPSAIYRGLGVSTPPLRSLGG